jgi:hypothetical protein
VGGSELVLRAGVVAVEMRLVGVDMVYVHSNNGLEISSDPEALACAEQG